MKKIIFALLLIISGTAGFAQNSGEIRAVSGFHGVQVSGGIDLYLSSGKESVSVDAANAEIRRHMVTEVVNGILRIHLEDNWNPGTTNPRMKAYVSVSHIDKLEASGGGDIEFKNEITTDNLTIRLSGGGNLEGKLKANSLDISQSGGSSVDLSGVVKDLSVNASGGGRLKGYDLITDYANIHTSGGSSGQLTVNKELSVITSGGGNINYKGTATVREIKTSGGGSVTHKD